MNLSHPFWASMKHPLLWPKAPWFMMTTSCIHFWFLATLTSPKQPTFKWSAQCQLNSLRLLIYNTCFCIWCVICIGCKFPKQDIKLTTWVQVWVIISFMNIMKSKNITGIIVSINIIMINLLINVSSSVWLSRLTLLKLQVIVWITADHHDGSLVKLYHDSGSYIFDIQIRRFFFAIVFLLFVTYYLFI